ncbi:hypothetical protein NDU88_007109 [Pleurodeles waltl]|uniref:Uncharacterized protein n=1 Tax=Pleurodeles waltl TaxID=8319 RepID=A0AAV7VRN9_PLEWA|nr:hypothetical protein NDU88_007109 [Pleurodeles waltl]
MCREPSGLSDNLFHVTRVREERGTELINKEGAALTQFFPSITVNCTRVPFGAAHRPHVYTGDEWAHEPCAVQEQKTRRARSPPESAHDKRRPCPPRLTRKKRNTRDLPERVRRTTGGGCCAPAGSQTIYTRRALIGTAGVADADQGTTRRPDLGR